jgi:hypothetical protein
MKSFLTIITLFVVPSIIYSQGATLVVGKGAYYAGGTNAYTVTAGDIKNDGYISTPSSNLKAIGTTQQRISCYTLSGSYCPNIFNTPVYNTVLGNVDQQNVNGIAIETNTQVMGTHIFTQGSTEIREGNYSLYNSSTPFSGNDASSKFFITTGSYHGLLKRNGVKATTLFPVGTAATANQYTPVSIAYSAGTDSFGVRVYNNVYYGYNTSNGDPLGGAGGIVNVRFVEKTWIVSKGTAVAGGFSTAGFTATLQWNLSNENVYFTPNRNDISIARNHDVMWLLQDPQGSSTNPLSGGPYTRTDVVTYDNAFYGYYPISVTAMNHVLPVIGLNLTGQLIAQNAALKWTTVTEANTSYFCVERSDDGINFNVIGKIAAYGNSNTVRHYNFTDSSISSLVSYYRIKAVDKDGKFIFSNTVLIKTNDVNKGIIVLTNPAHDDVKIFFKNSPGDYTIDLFNNAGSKIKTERTNAFSGSYIHTFHSGAIASGMYYIRLYNHQTKEITTLNVVVL